ncbi:MAG TPA: DUF2298 domain-containing protein, partial [Roseiflexaceae bacterium]|nr:DUF2298 domain-containing protein [Roseiflexaceae bacterium]
YHISSGPDAPAVTSTTIAVHPPSLPTERRPALLGERVGDLPVGDTFGQFGLNSTAEQIAAVLAWLVVWSALLVVGLPVAMLLFARLGRWQDAGWDWARPIGLLIVGYCVWLPVSAQLWIYDRTALGIGVLLALVLAVCATLLLGRREMANIGGRFVPPETLAAGLRTIGRQVRANGRRIVWCELIGAGAFAAMLVLRALNPDLWQPYWGGEKPFEFGLLNALVRSTVLPPYSPFFSDGTINYYYYGFFLMSVPLKATGIAPSIGFNLIIPTLYSMFAAGLFALAARIAGRSWVGLAAVVLVALLGNLAAVFPAGWSEGIRPVLVALAAGVPNFGAALGSWFVGPSRVIPNTINEFPFWGFLFADLHPHLIAMPFAVLALALTFELFSNRNPTGSARSITLLVAALVLGTLAVTNSWDLPTYAGVLLVGMAGAAWRSHGRVGQRLGRVAAAGVLAVATTGFGLFLFLPFFRSFVSPVGGFGLVTTPTALSDYLLIYGVYLACVVPVVLGAAIRLAALPLRRRAVRPLRALGIVAGSPEAARLPQ